MIINNGPAALVSIEFTHYRSVLLFSLPAHVAR